MSNTYLTKQVIGSTRGFNYAVVNRYTGKIVSVWVKHSDAANTARDLNRKVKGPKFERIA